MAKPSTIPILLWLALVASVVALVVAGAAFNQVAILQNKDIGKDIQREVRSVQQQADVDRARTQLTALRARIAAGAKAVDLEDEIALIRQDLRRAFESAGEKARDSWSAIDSQLDALQKSLRLGTADVLDVIDRVLDTLRREIRYG